jgi:thioredoxin-like negative regulator of GroEL
MTPIVNGLEEKYSGRFTFVRVDIDTEKGKKLGREIGFIGQPTFLFADAEGNEVRRLMGPQSRESMEQAVEDVLRR